MIKRELFRFFVIGTIAVTLDFLTYRVLILLDLININLAKATGFFIGTIFAYFANRFWTFGHNVHPPNNAIRFTLLYTASLSANVFINMLALKLLGNIVGVVQFAFLLATAASTILNFLGMKLYVFNAQKTLEAL